IATPAKQQDLQKLQTKSIWHTALTAVTTNKIEELRWLPHISQAIPPDILSHPLTILYHVHEINPIAAYPFRLCCFFFFLKKKSIFFGGGLGLPSKIFSGLGVRVRVRVRVR